MATKRSKWCQIGIIFSASDRASREESENGCYFVRKRPNSIENTDFQNRQHLCLEIVFDICAHPVRILSSRDPWFRSSTNVYSIFRFSHVEQKILQNSRVGWILVWHRHKIARFRHKIARFRHKIARFRHNIAWFRHKIARFRHNIAQFRLKIARNRHKTARNRCKLELGASVDTTICETFCCHVYNEIWIRWVVQ